MRGFDKGHGGSGADRSPVSAPNLPGGEAGPPEPWRPAISRKPWEPVLPPLPQAALQPAAYLYLTGKESALLELLTIAAGEPISSDELLSELYPATSACRNTIEAHVYNLRRKLRHHPEVRIETVRSRGYRLRYVEPAAG